jgi:hypothetical protein
MTPTHEGFAVVLLGRRAAAVGGLAFAAVAAGRSRGLGPSGRGSDIRAPRMAAPAGSSRRASIAPHPRHG